MANLPPSMGLQYVGEVVIDGGTGRLTVNLRNAAGRVLFSEVIQPVR
jgi:alkaline phosphatase D